MRYLYIGLIVVLTAVVLLFKIQNLQTATVSLLSMSVTIPVWLLVVGIYVLACSRRISRVAGARVVAGARDGG